MFHLRSTVCICPAVCLRNIVPNFLPQVGSAGQDVASTLTVDGRSSEGDIVVCGSTTGGLFADPALFAYESSSGPGAGGVGVKGTEAYCAKLGALDGHVRF